MSLEAIILSLVAIVIVFALIMLWHIHYAKPIMLSESDSDKVRRMIAMNNRDKS